MNLPKHLFYKFQSIDGNLRCRVCGEVVEAHFIYKNLQPGECPVINYKPMDIESIEGDPSDLPEIEDYDD